MADVQLAALAHALERARDPAARLHLVLLQVELGRERPVGRATRSSPVEQRHHERPSITRQSPTSGQVSVPAQSTTVGA